MRWKRLHNSIETHQPFLRYNSMLKQPMHTRCCMDMVYLQAKAPTTSLSTGRIKMATTRHLSITMSSRVRIVIEIWRNKRAVFSPEHREVSKELLMLQEV